MQRIKLEINPGMKPGILSDIADLVLGRRCVGCNEGGTILCPECDAHIKGHSHIARDFRFDEIQEGLRIPLAVACVYAPPMSTLIYSYKDAHVPALAPVLSRYLESALDELSTSGVPKATLTPIPTRSAAIRRRGFDAMELISRNLIKRGHVVEHMLTDNRTAGHSKALDSRSRLREVQDAFAITPTTQRLIKKANPIIIFDDVTTTGSTLKEAAMTLMQAGVQIVGVAAIAGARKR